MQELLGKRERSHKRRGSNDERRKRDRRRLINA
jgi:hypothetical protein